VVSHIPGVQVVSDNPGVQVVSDNPGAQVVSNTPGVQVVSDTPGVQWCQTLHVHVVCLTLHDSNSAPCYQGATSFADFANVDFGTSLDNLDDPYLGTMAGVNALPLPADIKLEQADELFFCNFLEVQMQFALCTPVRP
jgi:hypothetical protein